MCQAQKTKVSNPTDSPPKILNKITHVGVHCYPHGKPCVFILRTHQKTPRMYQPRIGNISKLANVVYDLVLKGEWGMRPNLMGEAGWTAWRKS